MNPRLKFVEHKFEPATQSVNMKTFIKPIVNIFLNTNEVSFEIYKETWR